MGRWVDRENIRQVDSQVDRGTVHGQMGGWGEWRVDRRVRRQVDEERAGKMWMKVGCTRWDRWAVGGWAMCLLRYIECL